MTNNTNQHVEKIAVCGYSINLAGDIDSGDKLADLILSKTQLRLDMVELGIAKETDLAPEDSTHPWLFQSRYCNALTPQQAENWDYRFFKISNKLRKSIDLRQLGVLHSVWEAIEDSGITPRELHRTRTGVFVTCPSVREPMIQAPDETGLRGSLPSSLSDHVSFFLGTHGPSVYLETACSSSQVAITLAVSALRSGDCDYAIVCGANHLTGKDCHVSLQNCGVLSRTGNDRPFDEEADGYVRLEGYSSVILRRLPDAIKDDNRILCSIVQAVAGSAGAAEGVKEGSGRTYEQPCGYGMKALMQRAYESSGVRPSQVRYLECHATGTHVGDVIELNAAAEVLAARRSAGDPLCIASVKGNTGHGETLAGMVSLAKIIEMFRRRVFMPSAGVANPRTDFDWQTNNMRIVMEAEPFPPYHPADPIIISSNSFGVGGSYAHLILEEYQPHYARPSKGLSESEDNSTTTSSLPMVLPLSAMSPDHLQLYATKLQSFLEEEEDNSDCHRLGDLCGTFANHRNRFGYRKALVANSISGMSSKLKELVEGPLLSSESCVEDKSHRILFVYTGQGAQWPGCGESLMAFPAYRSAVLEVDRQFKELSGWSLLDKAKNLPKDELRETMFAQPVTFMIQVGLTHLLEDMGLLPSMVVGHSAGEAASGYASGLLSLEDAVRMVYHRSTEQQSLAGSGRLLAVGLSKEEAKKLLEGGGWADTIEFACINSAKSTVLVGKEAILKEVEAAIPEGTFKAFVPGNIAFHSSACEPILSSIRHKLSFLDDNHRPSRVPFISTVTGKQEFSLDAEYWCHNVRHRVDFKAAIEYIFQDAVVAPTLVIEVGPHKTLAGPVAQICSGMGRDPVIVPTLKRDGHCADVMSELLGEMFQKGVELDLRTWYKSLGYSCINIPKHPFIKKKVRDDAQRRRRGEYSTGPVAGMLKDGGGGYHAEISDRTVKDMTDHKMGGQTILPGTFYVEMVLEAARLPCTLTDVDFKNICKIPKSTAGEPETLISLTLAEEPTTNSSYSIRPFHIRSMPAADSDLSLSVEHCVGHVVKSHRNGEDKIHHGAFGLLEPCEMVDIGEEGLEKLKEAHNEALVTNTDHFYGAICVEGLVDYGTSFRVGKSLHANLRDHTYLACLEFDSDAWEARGGCLGVQLMDGFFHLPFFLSTDPMRTAYFGGFKAGHFIRKPSTKEVYAYLKPDVKPPSGSRKTIGDYLVYDGTGALVVVIKGAYSIIGNSSDCTQLSQLTWQPRLTTPDASFLHTMQEDILLSSEESQVKAIALRLKSIIEAYQSHNNRVVFRVLEMVESPECQSVVEVLANIGLQKSDRIIVEAFLACHKTETVNLLGSDVNKTSWLRLRKLYLPSLATQKWADICFDAMIIQDWCGTGGAAYGENVEEQALTAMNQISSYLVPGAPVWVLETTTLESQQSWLQQMNNWGEGMVVQGPTSPLVAGRFGGPINDPHRRKYLVVTDDSSTAELLEDLMTQLDEECYVHSLDLVSKELTIDSTNEDWSQAISDALSSFSPLHEEFEGVVFLGSLSEDTPPGTQGFGRLVKLSAALVSQHERVSEITAKNTKPPSIWVVTQGAFSGKVRPCQTAIQDCILSISRELDFMRIRTVDMETMEELPKLANLLIQTPPEQRYLLTPDAVQVPRLFPVNSRVERSIEARADGPISYFCHPTAGFGTPGQVSVDFESMDVGPPKKGEVTIQIHMAGLNFRDVLLAIKLLPELSFEGSYYGPYMGMEAGGVVTAVGEGVKHLKVGDRVATSEPRCFGNRLNAPINRVIPLPENVTMEMAASVQCVYGTAYYSLVTIARIKKGQRVLIHAATGGVGHAAIAVCKEVGAIIYATASEKKQPLLKELGIDHIYDSRSTTWFDQIMADTNNEGVDAVLNSLAGEHQVLGVQILRPGGHFLEIGKADIYANSKIGLLSLRKNAHLHCIDMDRLALDDPETVRKTSFKVFKNLHNGIYPPIPVTSFPMDRISEAINYMKGAKHIGKVVLTNFPSADHGPETNVVRLRTPQTIFSPDACYIITGGAGGFGSSIVRHAFNRGARHFVITVTSVPERVQRLFPDLLTDPNCTIEAVVADLGKEEDVIRVVDVAKSQPFPLMGIFHAAGVSIDTKLEDITAEAYERVAGVKAMGGYYLHKHTLDIKTVEQFAMISSNNIWIGAIGTACYGAANAFLDGLCFMRRSMGLPATTFNMSSLSDVGLLMKDYKVRQLQLRAGVQFVSSFRAAADLEDAMVCNVGRAAEMYYSYMVLKTYPTWSTYLHNDVNTLTLGNQRQANGVLSPEEVQAIVKDIIKTVTGNNDFATSAVLSSVGLDSFSTIMLINNIASQLGVELTAAKLRPDMTVAELSKVIHVMRSGGSTGPSNEPAEGQVEKPSVEADDARPTVSSIKLMEGALQRLEPIRVQLTDEEEEEDDELTADVGMSRSSWGNNKSAVKILEEFRAVCERKGRSIFSTWLNDQAKEQASLTYVDIWKRAGIIAHRLRAKLGAKKGDRVILCYSFGLEFFVALLGCMRAGVIAVPIYPPNPTKLNASLKKMQLIVKDSGACICLTDKLISTFKQVQKLNLLHRSKWPKGLTWFNTQAVSKGKTFDEVSLHEDDLAFLQYTSGSTGNPKGVMITFANLHHNTAKAMMATSAAAAKQKGISMEEGMGVSWLPQYHDMGLVTGIIMPFLVGSRMYHFSPISFLKDPLMWIKVMSDKKAHWTTAPAFALHLCVQRWKTQLAKGPAPKVDLSSLIFIQTGGEPLSPERVTEFYQTFESCGLQAVLTAGYGLAEHVVMVSNQVMTPDSLAVHPGEKHMLGHGDVRKMYEATGVTAIIVDPSTNELITSEDEVGEIWVNSPSVALGYWQQPQATEEVFHANLADDPATDYLRTGDLGRICRGQLYISGRIKDLIIIGGKNYYPQDIEEAASEASSIVRPGSIAAFEVSQQGESLMAIVFEVRPDTGLVLEKEIEKVSNHVLESCGLRPAGIFAITKGAIPKTTSGKIRRSETRAMLVAGSFKVLNAITVNPHEWSVGPGAAAAPAAINKATTAITSMVASSGKKSKPAAAAHKAPAGQEGSNARPVFLQPRSSDDCKVEQSMKELSCPTPSSSSSTERLSFPNSPVPSDEDAHEPQPPSPPTTPPTPATTEEAPVNSSKLSEVKQVVDYCSARAMIPVEVKPWPTTGETPQRLAIVGIGCRFPGGSNDVDAFWDFLVSAKDAVVDMPKDRWSADAHPELINKGAFLDNADMFDAAYFGLSTEEAKILDPQQRICLEVAYEAVHDAGYNKAMMQGTNTGVYIGTTNNWWGVSNDSSTDDNLYKPMGVYTSFTANRVACLMGTQGPSMVVDTACASSGSALDVAAHHILTGTCKQALVGAVSIYSTPFGFDLMGALRMQTPDGRCKVFDASADGYVRGEGCGVLFIKRLEDAQKDHDNIYAIIAATSLNHGGKRASVTAPSQAAEQSCILDALQRANIHPDEVDFFEAHGTGTALGDPVEFAAMRGVFCTPSRDPAHRLVVGAVKTNVGHLEQAAGIAGLIKTILVLKHRSVPPNLHLKTLNPAFNLRKFPVVFPDQPIKLDHKDGNKPLVAVVNSAGFGGCNAVVVLEEAMNVREEKKVGFLFTSQGLLSSNMGKELFDSQPVFRDAILACEASIEEGPEPWEVSLSALLYPTDKATAAKSSALLQEVKYYLPAIYSLQYALAQMWQHQSLVPSMVTGEGVGAVVAACIAQSIDLKTALALVARWASCTSIQTAASVPSGRVGLLVEVPEPLNKVKAGLAELDLEGVTVVASMSPQSVLISGPAAQVRKLVSHLGCREKMIGTVPNSRPSIMSNDLLLGLKSHKGAASIISAYDGQSSNLFDLEGFIKVHHLPASLDVAVDTMKANDCQILLEISLMKLGESLWPTTSQYIHSSWSFDAFVEESRRIQVMARGVRASERIQWNHKRFPWLLSNNKAGNGTMTKVSLKNKVLPVAPEVLVQQGLVSKRGEPTQEDLALVRELNILPRREREARLLTFIVDLVGRMSGDLQEGEEPIPHDVALYTRMDSLSMTQFAASLTQAIPAAEAPLIRQGPAALATITINSLVQTISRAIDDHATSSYYTEETKWEEDGTTTGLIKWGSTKITAVDGGLEEEKEALEALHPEQRRERLESMLSQMVRAAARNTDRGFKLDMDKRVSDYMDSIGMVDFYTRLYDAIPSAMEIKGIDGPHLTFDSITSKLMAALAALPNSYEVRTGMALSKGCLPFLRCRKKGKRTKDESDADDLVLDGTWTGVVSETFNSHTPVTTKMTAYQWVRPLGKPTGEIKQRMLLLPWNGQMWNLPNTECIGVILPRPNDAENIDPEMRSMELCAKRILESMKILGLLDKPVVVFGHCIGAFIGLEVARQLERDHGIVPKRLIISSMVLAPSKKFYFRGVKKTTMVPDWAIKYGMVKLQLAPAELMKRHSSKLLVAMFRSNFLAYDRYNVRCLTKEEALQCPITVIHGSHDSMWRSFGIMQSNRQGWQEYTQQPLEVKVIPGDHSYINERRGGPLVVNYLKHTLSL